MYPLPVDQDARGILDPVTGLTRFRLDRYAPSGPVARLVDRYWLSSWDLADREPHAQRVFPHPVVNVVLTIGTATVHGPATGVRTQSLEGTGWALGVMFRPAGFRPLLGCPMRTIVDAALPWPEVLGADAPRDEDPRTLIAAVDRFLASRLPGSRHPAEDTAALVERIAADPAGIGVEALAEREGTTVRSLQRRFADHVGLSPKTVIRRYRFYEVAERARTGPTPDWSALAADLGYSDQSHLIRDFTAVVGAPPARYAARSRS